MSFFSKLDGFSRKMVVEDADMPSPSARKSQYTAMADEAFDEEDSES